MVDKHPFLYFTEDEIEGLRQKKADAICGGILEQVARVADSRLDWEVYTPSLVPPFAGYRLKASERMNYDEAYAEKYVQQYRMSMLIRNLSEFYAFCYLMLGKPEYLEAARRWLLTPCRWDRRIWAAYEPSRMEIDEYTSAELQVIETSGGSCVGVVPDPRTRRKNPVFEDTGIFTTFKLRGLSVAYDWMYPYLTEEERDTVRGALAYQGDRLYHHALNGNALLMRSILNHTWLDTAGLGLAGVCLYHEHPPARDWAQFCRDRFVEVLLPGTVGIDGEFPEPGPYMWEYSYTGAVLFFEAWRRLTGEDLVGDSPFRRVSHMLTQVLSPACGLAFDDDMTGFDRADGMSYSFRPLMFLFASRFKEPTAQRYALYEGFDPPGAEKGKLYPGGKWYPEEREYSGHWEYIWCDESIEPGDPEGGEPSTLLRDTGWAILRTGWKPEDTWMAFRSGTYLGLHDRFDQNKIVLQSGGEKLLEHLYGANYMYFEYFKNTPGSNTILVDGQGQEEMAKDLGHEILIEQYKSDHTAGKVVFFEASETHDAVVGDASGAYGDRLTRFVRYIAFVKPSWFLVLDDLAAPEPRRFDWLAHSYGEITIEGRDVRIRKPNAGLVIRSLLPHDAEWFLERTPPDTNGERLLKHLALRPAEPSSSLRLLNGLFLSSDGIPEPSVEVQELDDRVVVLASAGGERVEVSFDLEGRRVDFA